MTGTIIEIASGKLQCITDKNIHAFKGIPYGGPTGGKNRFMPPTPPEPWSGIKDATQYGQACWQPAETVPGSLRLLGAVGISSMGEDCLVLNVWTPGLNDGGKRPVMVWLHGGGYFSGSGDHIPYYEGASLARTGDVVVVSINHRLGVFGYLYLKELADDSFASSGNAGMLDIVQALEWVRDNIEVFGGDPGNVTIFGESGGGAKVSTLTAMPAAKGLFHRGIAQSGAGQRAWNSEDATRVAKSLLDMFGLKPGQINELQKIQTSMLYTAWTALKPAIGMPMGQFSPVMDGDIIPAHPYDPVATSIAADVSLMIGTNKDETTFMFLQDPNFGRFTEESMRETLLARVKEPVGAPMTDEMVDELIAKYHKIIPDATPSDILIAITSDRLRMSSVRVAERKSAGSPAPVYMYLFTWESPFVGGILKSCHTLEIPFVFNNVEPTIGILGDSPGRIRLAENMSRAWVSFARDGNPNHGGIPFWPTYSAEKRSTMLFDIECSVEDDPRGKERLAWEGQ